MAILLACICLTAWIWSLPLSLPVSRDWGQWEADVYAEAQFRERARRTGNPNDSWTPPTAGELAEWKDRNKDLVDVVARRAESRFKAQYTYRGTDGRDHVYLGGHDSYFWLYLARKLLRSGRICDPGPPGRCLDARGHAPVGAKLGHPYSIHIFALAGLHKLLTLVQPRFPLDATAQILPLIVATLSVVPAFFIGRRLAGILGGTVAAVMIALSPPILLRSLGGDTDVWNLALPLFVIWVAMAALSPVWWRRCTFAVLAGAIAGLHATIWRGWVFTYLLVLTGLLAYLAIQVFSAVRGTRSWRLWRDEGVQVAAQSLIIFYIATRMFATLAGVGDNYLNTYYIDLPFKIDLLFKALADIVGSFADTASRSASNALAWPDVFGTVSELTELDLADIADGVGSRTLMLVALVGLLLAFFPRGQWRVWHYGLLAAGIGLYASVVFFDLIDEPLELILVIAAPPIGVAIVSLVEKRGLDPGHALAVIMLVWFLAALSLTHNGVRFLLLVTTPFTLALATAAGRIFERSQRLSEAWLGRWRKLGDAAAFLLLATIVVLPISRGVATARGYYPMINDAWYDSLTALREESDSRSIVNVWWDYGHWAKYVADRPVTLDGASLETHLPHWMAKALTAASSRESLGVLRMLNCASEASPLPEGRRGAFGRVKATGRDNLATYSIVAGLIVRNRNQAEAYLKEQGFTARQRKRILATTHCDPPESYLVVSTHLLQKIGRLFGIGYQDTRRKLLARRLRAKAVPEAIDWIVAKFGYTRQEAQALYDRTVGSAKRPDIVFVATEWSPCRAVDTSGMLECRFSLRTKTEPMRGLFRYRPGQWSKATLKFDPATERSFGLVEGSPGLVLLAGETHLARIVPDAPVHRVIAVLLDPATRRVMIGTPATLTSTLVQLVALGGRYVKHFERSDEKVANTGERVSTWRLNWEAAEGQ